MPTWMALRTSCYKSALHQSQQAVEPFAAAGGACLQPDPRHHQSLITCHRLSLTGGKMPTTDFARASRASHHLASGDSNERQHKATCDLVTSTSPQTCGSCEDRASNSQLLLFIIAVCLKEWYADCIVECRLSHVSHAEHYQLATTA